MISYLWIPLIIIVSIALSIVSKKHNDNSINYFIYLLFIIGLFNSMTWILMTKYTKNIIFDSMLFSVLISSVTTITFVFLGAGSKFTLIQWIGTFLVLIGFILMRLKI